MCVCVCGSFFLILILETFISRLDSFIQAHRVCSFNSTVLSQRVKVNLPVVKSAKQFRMSAWITYFPMYFYLSKCHLSNSAKEYGKKKKRVNKLKCSNNFVQILLSQPQSNPFCVSQFLHMLLRSTESGLATTT